MRSQRHALVPIVQEAGGPQARYGQVRKISPPPGFYPRTVQPVASRYTHWATRPTIRKSTFFKKCEVSFVLRLALPTLNNMVLKAAIRKAVNLCLLIACSTKFRLPVWQIWKRSCRCHRCISYACCCCGITSVRLSEFCCDWMGSSGGKEFRKVGEATVLRPDSVRE
jgi:hypothetical protein